MPRLVCTLLSTLTALAACGGPTAVPRALQELDDAVRRGEYRDIHAVLVAKDGALVHEMYFTGEDEHGRTGALGAIAFDRETRHDLRSASKSVVSLLLGIALAGDTLALDRPILDFLPEDRHLAGEGWDAVTLRHVLDMTSGIAWSEAGSYAGSENDGAAMGRSADQTKFVLQRDIVTTPGSEWNYSGANTHLLMEVIHHLTNRSFLDFARDVLFTPLGITDLEWMPYAGSDLPDADSGLRLRPVDALTLGLLLEANGVWHGQQIVPAAWITGSWGPVIGTTDSLVELGPDATVATGYARQWWHGEYDLPYGRVTAHWAAGNGGQLIVIVPAARLVVVTTGGRYDQQHDAHRLIIERILPWALGDDDRAYAFPIQRSFRAAAPGEWQDAAQTEAEQTRYLGRYLYEGDTVVVRSEDGVLRLDNFAGDRGEPFALVHTGNHQFAMGRYQNGVLTRLYWPQDRVTFVLSDGRVTSFIDHPLIGKEYGRAQRIE